MQMKAHGRIFPALAASLLLFITALGIWRIVPSPVVPLVAICGAIFFLIALRSPFVAVLLFVALSLFRLPDAFPFLQSLQLPFFFALMAVTALLWSCATRTRPAEPIPLVLKLFAVFFLLVTAGTLFAANRPAAYETWTGVYAKIGVITFAIALLANTRADLRNASRVFIASGAAIAAVALGNWVSGHNLVEGSRAAIGDTQTSLLSDPNDLALVLLFPLSFTLANVSGGVGRMDRLAGFAILPVLVAGIVATQSRGALLGTVAVFAIFMSRMTKSRTLVAIGFAAVAVILYAAMDISERRSGGDAEPLLDESAAGRLIAWRAGINMALANPLTGVGLNNFALSFSEYTATSVPRDLAPHSTWFGVLGETGFPGLIVFVLMTAALIASARRSEQIMRLQAGDPTLRAFATALIAGAWGYCVSGSFLTQGFTWPLYILIGLTAALEKIAARGSERERYNGQCNCQSCVDQMQDGNRAPYIR